MKAIISGQAGLAILMDGQSIYSIDVDSTDQLIKRDFWEVRHLLNEASDAYLLKNTTKERIVAELERAWRRDRALQLMLILLDPTNEQDLRQESAECLEDLLVSEDEREQLANVLYASPLPDTSEATQVSRQEVCSMTTIAILPDNPQGSPESFRAVAREVQSSGTTVGQAVDALRAQLGGPEQTTLVVVQPMRPDEVFTAEQQQRLADLLSRWRVARDAGAALPPQEQAELEALIEAELRAATERSAALVRQMPS